MKRWLGVALCGLIGACRFASAGGESADSGAEVSGEIASSAAADTATEASAEATVEAATGGDVSTCSATGGVPASFTTKADNAPRNLHLTWQHDPATTVTISWATAQKNLDGYTPEVWFAPVATAGDDGAKLPLDTLATASGSGETYSGADANDASGMSQFVAWNVELTGLAPDTTYVYRAGTWKTFCASGIDAPDLSAVQTFTTAPKKGTREPMSIVVAGDSRGGSQAIQQNAVRLGAIDARFWLFTGDFTNLSFQNEWDDWMSAMGPILSHRPLMPVQGNHEIFADMYYAQFALPIMPGVTDDYKEHVWSVDYGNVHLVGLDSNTDSTVQDTAAWLDANLTSARADPDIDWIFVAMHHPTYSACTAHGSTTRLQEYWAPIFEKHDVDLVFAGHDHDYERTHPIRAGKAVASGPVYIVAGGFYSPGYTNGTDWWTVTSAHGDKGDLVELAIDGKKLTLTAVSGDGAVTLDTLTLTK